MMDVAELNKKGVVAVHIMGQEPIETKEVEPSHVVCINATNLVLTALPTSPQGVDPIPQILNADPMRKRARITVVGSGSVFLCHSEAQAREVLLGNTASASAGAPIGAGSYPFDGGAPLWIVSTSALFTNGTLVGIITERRGERVGHH